MLTCEQTVQWNWNINVLLNVNLYIVTPWMSGTKILVLLDGNQFI